MSYICLSHSRAFVCVQLKFHGSDGEESDEREMLDALSHSLRTSRGPMNDQP